MIVPWGPRRDTIQPSLLELGNLGGPQEDRQVSNSRQTCPPLDARGLASWLRRATLDFQLYA